MAKMSLPRLSDGQADDMALADPDRASPLKASTLASRKLNAKEAAAKDQARSGGSNKPLVEKKGTAASTDEGKDEDQGKKKGKDKGKGSVVLRRGTLKKSFEKLFRKKGTETDSNASNDAPHPLSATLIPVSSDSDKGPLRLTVPQRRNRKAIEDLVYGSTDPEKNAASSPQKPKSDL